MKRLKIGVTLRCELLEMLLKTNVIIGTTVKFEMQLPERVLFYECGWKATVGFVHTHRGVPQITSSNLF